MTWKRLATSVVLAGGLLAAPLEASPGIPGPDDALASTCRLAFRLCSTIDLGIWQGEVCVEYCVRR